MRLILSGLALLAFNTAEAQAQLAPSDEVAAFRAAGFKRVAGKWHGCGDPGTDSYQPGSFQTTRDINGDGRSDAVIVESSSYCFGMTGEGFWLVSKQANGSWKLVTSETGIATFQPRHAVAGWPDIEIGGPGFCFPVERWNGQKYVVYRYQYEGKSCRPRD
jgi:hypothetical protein